MGSLTFNYNQDTQDMIGAIIGGIRVETPVLSTLATYWTNPVTYAVFNVTGLIKIIAMYMEVTGVFDAGASTLVFRWTGTTPAVGIATMGVASGSMATSAVGSRWTFLGPGTVTAGPSAGISYLPAPFLVGGKTGAGVNATGVISALIAGGTQAADASGRYVLHYAAMTEGANAVSAI